MSAIESENMLLKFQLEQQKKDFEIKMLQMQIEMLSKGNDNNKNNNNNSNNKRILPTTFMRNKMKKNIAFKMINFKIPFEEYNPFINILDDESRNLYFNKENCQTSVIYILRKYIQSIGGLEKSPIVCLDIKREKIMFHTQNEDGKIEWVQDTNYSYFKNMVRYILDGIFFGNDEETKNMPTDSVLDQDKYAKRWKIIDWYMKCYNTKNVSIAQEEVIVKDPGLKRIAWDDKDYKSVCCYDKLLKEFCELFCISDVVEEYNDSL